MTPGVGSLRRVGLAAQCDALRAENDRLRAALAHYANPANWPLHRQTWRGAPGPGQLHEVYQPDDVHPPNKHGWERAAAALEEETSCAT